MMEGEMTANAVILLAVRSFRKYRENERKSGNYGNYVHIRGNYGA